MTTISLKGRLIGPGEPCLIIAEAGVNHDGLLERALALVDAAHAARADAVKFQTFRAEALVSPGAAKAEYQKQDRAEESQLEMIRRLELPFDAFPAIQTRAAERGLLFLSTPFDELSADWLAQLEVPAFKVGSGDLTNLPFLRYLARRGVPLILSTGMSTLREVRDAVDAVRETAPVPLALLHCVSSYPADPADANLRAMATLAAAFEVPVGYSDHTAGIETALAAVALGACVVEKHLTLDRALPGPDHAASLEPDAFARMVEGIRTVERALGDGIKRPRPSEADAASVARRSLVITRDLEAGTVLDGSHVAIRRPGTGIPPS
jgi:N,N'-diacetyllegionaminate synthase